MQSTTKSRIFATALRRDFNDCEAEKGTWPVWVAAFTMLALLGTGSAGAAPLSKSTAKSRANHARPAARETRLFAIGTVNPDTASIKAITGDNRFTWIQMPANVVIVQGGKTATVDAISEGSKLICQGKWVDDAWGPVFQASRIEILGSIGDANLSQKIAAACQSIQGTSQSSDLQSSFSNADTASLNADTASLDAETDQLKSYNEASEARQEVTAKASDEVERLAAAAENDPTMRHRPAAVKAMREAVSRYKQALDAENSLGPIPTALLVSEAFSHRANEQDKVYADLRLQYFGLKSRHGWELMRQSLAKSGDLIDEAKAALDDD